MLFKTRIPTHDNDGNEFDAATRFDIEDMVRIRFGGFSLDGPGRGVWVADDDVVYDESSYLLTVVCSREDYADARTLVVEIGRKLKQLAMYFEVTGMDGAEIIDVD